MSTRALVVLLVVALTLNATSTPAAAIDPLIEWPDPPAASCISQYQNYHCHQAIDGNTASVHISTCNGTSTPCAWTANFRDGVPMFVTGFRLLLVSNGHYPGYRIIGRNVGGPDLTFSTSWGGVTLYEKIGSVPTDSGYVEFDEPMFITQIEIRSDYGTINQGCGWCIAEFEVYGFAQDPGLFFEYVYALQVIDLFGNVEISWKWAQSFDGEWTLHRGATGAGGCVDAAFGMDGDPCEGEGGFERRDLVRALDQCGAGGCGPWLLTLVVEGLAEPLSFVVQHVAGYQVGNVEPPRIGGAVGCYNVTEDQCGIPQDAGTADLTVSVRGTLPITVEYGQAYGFGPGFEGPTVSTSEPSWSSEFEGGVVWHVFDLVGAEVTTDDPRFLIVATNAAGSQQAFITLNLGEGGNTTIVGPGAGVDAPHQTEFCSLIDFGCQLRNAFLPSEYTYNAVVQLRDALNGREPFATMVAVVQMFEPLVNAMMISSDPEACFGTTIEVELPYVVIPGELEIVVPVEVCPYWVVEGMAEWPTVRATLGWGVWAWWGFALWRSLTPRPTVAG